MWLRRNQKGSCLSRDPPMRTKYVLVLILSQELCELCSAEGGEGGEAATSNYLGMRSLFGSISSRLWLKETQPSSTTGCVISLLRPPQRTWTFFCKFGRGTFCPAVGFVIRAPLSSPASDISCLLPNTSTSFQMCQLRQTCDVWMC